MTTRRSERSRSLVMMVTMRKVCWTLSAVGCVALSACGAPGKEALAEAEALAAQGKIAEAAQKMETVCALAPTREECPAAEQRAADLWSKAAEQAVTEGRYREAERLLLRARASANGGARAALDERLEKPDIVQGLKLERAQLLTSKSQIRPIVEELAQHDTPAGGAAKEWLRKELPGLLADGVMNACGPGHEGSCARAWAALKDSGASGEIVDRAREAFEAEERRVYPLRLQAEGFLPVFAARKRGQDAYSECTVMEFRPRDTTEREWENQCAMKAWPGDAAEDRYARQKNQDALWRRTLKNIADPALTEPLVERKGAAETKGAATRETIPAPKPAAKKK